MFLAWISTQRNLIASIAMSEYVNGSPLARCEVTLACWSGVKQALQGAMVTGPEKEGELATTSMKFEFRWSVRFPPVSANKTNVEKHVKTRAKGNDVISTNQHCASTCSMQIFKFQGRTCKLSYLFCQLARWLRLLNRKTLCGAAVWWVCGYLL